MVPFYDNLQNDSKPTSFYSDEFRQVLYTHLAQLKESAKQTITVEPAQAAKYVGNYKGLLASKNIPAWMHWPVMLVNGVENDYRHIGSVRQILLPDSMYIERLYSIWSTKKR